MFCRYHNFRSARWHPSQLLPLARDTSCFRFTVSEISKDFPNDSPNGSRMIAAPRSPPALCGVSRIRVAPGRAATRRSTTTSIADSCGPVESSELTEVSPLGQADAGVRGEWRGVVELGWWLRVRASHGFSAPLRSAPLRACLVRYRPRSSWAITISASSDARSERVCIRLYTRVSLLNARESN